MVTITINIENGNEASEACREVARMIDNGYTSGMIGCSGDTFEIEGDIFSDDEEVHTNRVWKNRSPRNQSCRISLLSVTIPRRWGQYFKLLFYIIVRRG